MKSATPRDANGEQDLDRKPTRLSSDATPCMIVSENESSLEMDLAHTSLFSVAISSFARHGRYWPSVSLSSSASPERSSHQYQIQLRLVIIIQSRQDRIATANRPLFTPLDNTSNMCVSTNA